MRAKKLPLFSIALMLISNGLVGQTTNGATIIPVKNTWPAKEIPASVPEYKGKVANYGNGGEANWFQIYVIESNPKNVSDYVAQYQKNGWTVSKDNGSDIAQKEQYAVVIHYYKEQGLVGITISTRSTDKQWPVKEFPFIPQFGKCLSSNFREYEYNLTIDIKKANESDIKTYKQNLITNGWEGDPEGDEFYWRKNGLDIALQISDQGDGNWSFDISK